jgi:hypothetical protein
MDFLHPWPPPKKYSNPNFMSVNKFKDKYRGMIVIIPEGNRLPVEADEHLFSVDHDISRYLNHPKYRVVSVNEHETGDFVDFTIPVDLDQKPYKIGYYVIREHLIK